MVWNGPRDAGACPLKTSETSSEGSQTNDRPLGRWTQWTNARRIQLYIVVRVTWAAAAAAWMLRWVVIRPQYTQK